MDERHTIIPLLLVAAIAVLTLLCAGCTAQRPPLEDQASTASAGPVRALLIATTTSLDDTGLWDAIEDFYEKKYGVDLRITSQGTGKALELGKSGDVDLEVVHSPSQEKAFLDEGWGVNHRCFAYNYFLIVGPETDPAGIRGLTPEEGFARLMALGKNGTAGVQFVSRGDNSGTHGTEKTIWKNAKYNYTRDVQGSGAWYLEAGKGMGDTLVMASEKGAYTLTDEGTYLAFKGQLALTPIISEGTSLLNRYSVMAINPTKHPNANIAEANRFIDWILSEEGREIVGSYGTEKYGKPLFTSIPADACSAAPFNCVCSGNVTTGASG
ncbi:MAG: substrate-binding domain-containing protein [Methanomicrobiales archaeon]|nr:substrate-binding domain-containing protein [Methanomicrobiales archaeon]